jgi:hypothetical protein
MSSIFSGKAGRLAALDTGSRNATTGGNINNWYDDAKTDSINALTTGAGNAQGALARGLTDATGSLTAGYGAARNDITQGAAAGQGYLGQIQGNYQPYAQTGSLATGMLANSYGLNGAGGNAAATSAFQASPGYQWQADQAADLAARHASATGTLASGNTLDAITRLGSNLANQEYGNWRSGLSGLAGQGLQAAAGQSQGNALQGALADSTGRALGGLDTAQGTGLAGLQTGAATGMAGIDTGLGTSASSVFQNNAAGKSGANLALTQSTDQAAQQGLLAGQQAQANSWGLGMAGANLASGLMGSAFGSGGSSGSGGGGGWLNGLKNLFAGGNGSGISNGTSWT